MTSSIGHGLIVVGHIISSVGCRLKGEHIPSKEFPWYCLMCGRRVRAESNMQGHNKNNAGLAIASLHEYSDAEAKVDALVKALKLIEGTPGFGHTYAARIARDALAALQGSKVDD